MVHLTLASERQTWGASYQSAWPLRSCCRNNMAVWGLVSWSVVSLGWGRSWCVQTWKNTFAIIIYMVNIYIYMVIMANIIYIWLMMVYQFLIQIAVDWDKPCLSVVAFSGDSWALEVTKWRFFWWFMGTWSNKMEALSCRHEDIARWLGLDDDTR